MKADKQIATEARDGQEAALRRLVRLLARQAAAEFVRDRLQDRTGSR